MVRYSGVFVQILAIGALFVAGEWRPVGSVAWGQTAQEKSVEKAGDAATPSSAANRAEQETPEPEDADPLGSPRKALRTFIVAMEGKDYRTAILALDFSAIDPAPDPFEQIRYAQRLKDCMDRLSLVDPSKVSDDPDSTPVPFPPEKADSEIVLSGGEDGRWRFTADTVAEIDSIYMVLKDSPRRDVEVSAPEPAASEDPTKVLPAGSSDPDQEPDTPPDSPSVVPSGLKSARRTMRTLFDSIEAKDFAPAVEAIDFSAIEAKDSEIGPYAKLESARRLKEVIERMSLIDYAKISDDPAGPTYRFPPDEINQPIEITRDEAQVWRFSANTAERIEALHAIYIDKPILNVSEEERPWYDRKLLLGNETWRLLALFATIFMGILLGNFARAALKWRADVLERRGHTLRAVVSKTLAATAVGILFLIGLSAGMQALILEHEVEALASTVIRIVFDVVIGYICFRLVDVAVEMLRELATRTGSTLNNMLAPIVSTSLRLTIIIMVVLDIATTVSDQPPSTVLAGLGAGGLAIGLAAQDTIKNLFGSVMIFADRPFELGDRIEIDGHDGPVEQVGFRSTRIRTLEGHLVTIPNGEMANKTIRNIGKRPYIRRVMNIHVTCDTPPEKIQQALEILRELLTDHEGMQDDHPPRVFLDDFLDSGLNLRATYWYHPPDYWDYCAFNERINLQVVERFRAEGIRFALPSQRLFLAGEPDQPLSRDPRIA